MLTQLEKHIDALEERIRQRIASLGWVPDTHEASRGFA